MSQKVVSQLYNSTRVSRTILQLACTASFISEESKCKGIIRNKQATLRRHESDFASSNIARYSNCILAYWPFQTCGKATFTSTDLLCMLVGSLVGHRLKSRDFGPYGILFMNECCYNRCHCMQCSKWAGICRYTIPELFSPKFIPALINMRYIHLPFFRFFDGISLFRFQEVYRHF
jgi:hypothetical protein